MIQITMQVSEELAKQCQTVGRWLPTIIELGFIKFRTIAVATASEVIEFLSENPSPEDLADFHVSESSQLRLQRLLALNGSGCLSESEQLELDELQTLEHIIIMLKTQAAVHLQNRRSSN
jgi:hypothetical protein